MLLDPVGGFATLVWAPTGIALAAMLIYGTRVWPAILLGAVGTNLLTGAPVLVAAGIGVGNTLEAVCGVLLVRRFAPGFRTSLDRLTDVLEFTVFAALIAPTISASVGVMSLLLGGVIASGQAAETWRAWWVGDFIGALLVAPTILAWVSFRPSGLARRQVVEAAALGATAVAISAIVFFGWTPFERSSFVQAYVAFPVLIWAAVRFGQRGSTAAVLITSIVAVAGTAAGNGPFARQHLHDSLFALQTFMGIVATSFLVLAATIAERTRAQMETRRALDAEALANRAKADFLAVMSHELRTPLNAISGYVELLSMGVQGPLTPEQREALARIQRNQRHLLSVIEDILSFTRLEAGKLVFNRVAVRLADAFDALEPLIQHELRRKHLAFTRNPCDPTLAVLADRDKLDQILLNLLSNATKYTEHGGSVEIGAQQNGDHVRIVVKDSGIGIAPEQVAKVFEPFFQVERGTTRRYPGVGLGLSIVRDLARAMQGDADVESVLGQGTTVTVRLPKASAS